MKKLTVLSAIIAVISLCVIAPHAEDTLISAGKEYTKTGEYYGDDGNIQHPDEDGITLTDGIKGEAEDIGFSTPIWYGMAQVSKNSDLFEGRVSNSITLDLEADYNCGRFVLYSEEFNLAGIDRPETVIILTSTDGESWEEAGRCAGVRTVAQGEKNDGLYTFTVEKKVTARFVKFICTYTNSWVFVSEVEVYSDGEPSPTPSKPLPPQNEDDPADTSEPESEVEASDGSGTPAGIFVMAAVAVVAVSAAAVYIVKKRKSD